MILQALLVSKDDPTAETLIRVLSQFGVAVARSNAVEVAVARLSEEHFDQVIVDFDDPETASLMLETCRRLTGPDRNPPVTVALLPDRRQIRAMLGAGAHFILTKPVSEEQASATLRAASAILKRERRQSLRVSLQAPVSIRVDENNTIEGILLDLSTGGMYLLAAKPVAVSALVRLEFDLPDSKIHVEADAEVAWVTPNGQTGVRFLNMETDVRERMCDWLNSRSQMTIPEEPVAVSACKLTDLSLGGCYVETESPFPQASAVDLCLKASGLEVHAEGLVRVMHPGHGMGIEFPARTEEQRKSVGEFIDFLTSQPGAQPVLETSPRSLRANAVDLSQTGASSGDAEDPLLELLRTGSALEQEEFLGELARQRTPADVNQ
ncbi:MAG TPA: PilZ domain-containing protein [Terriglobales bacterium]|nr:PilZ domain-containing protein [Terriglobales bacterium]